MTKRDSLSLPWSDLVKEAGIFFNSRTSRFESRRDTSTKNIIGRINSPLSAILQITRKCNMKCLFCSETEMIKDPSLEDLKIMKENLTGTPRIFLSGGEPAVRRDLDKIIDLFYGSFIIGLPTNALIPDYLISIIKEKVAFVNVGLDGPRNITKRIRGDYDAIMRGIDKLILSQIDISLTSVIMRSTLDSILYTCQIADVLKANKLKLTTPVPKGRALNLPKAEYINYSEANNLFKLIRAAKKKYGWNPKITLTIWTPEVEGYSILIYPNGNTYAWPVYNQKDKAMLLGNILKDTIQDIWLNYPFKENHINKYLGKSIFMA